MNNHLSEEEQDKEFEMLRKEYNIPEFITVLDATIILGISAKEVRKKCTEKEIKAQQRFGNSGKWYIETKQFMNHENWDMFVEKSRETKEKSIRFAQKMIELLNDDDSYNKS
ncbi:hypothetical protein [Bacillus cereus group sp. TH152-1LC]|uniref:hypothetical protein n=1 Tax=Bacillus cereus group sp. TH152-1LC TaxID=3018060 RepID=UPI0022DFC158|nr:hypothetical protein [Bacillus cereus group sp. TH152-1LC]MDA1675615.1 hypothetical protein [Bacillus cereus group sp. TH152-1LC]